MSSTLVAYLSSRPDSATFLIPADVARTVDELFPRADWVLPQPYRIYPADETQAPALGFPVAESAVMKDIEARLDRWLAEEILWQVSRQQEPKEKAQLAFNAYLSQLMKAAENALMSNLLNDYHAIFWLAHSVDLARHFSALPRRVSAVDTQTGRIHGDALKYRIFSRWVSETRDQMTQLAAKASTVLDGEEQRGLQFFRLLQEDVLLLTEEFIGPDLRELRSFLNGYLRRDFQAFRDAYERMRNTATELVQRDRTFRAALPLFGVNPDHGVTVALLLDSRFQSFLFENATMQNAVSREDREQFQLIARRVREFAVLNQLRRGITWMSVSPGGAVASTDRRSDATYSRSTRPLDFGRPGVVDPMVHRFGLIYDISSFSETLGNIRRGGRKEEISSYRQMVLFQRKLDRIAERHKLQFEKFLGDGAFYTTRRANRLVGAAVEIQLFYSEMRRKGFAFNKGLRIAVNYGYYRLLPMKSSSDSPDRITEFYGPGIIELSRLTTGKATEQIDDLASFLVAHGYDQAAVRQFFAPLALGVDVVDHEQQAREFHAYINSNGHLVNEGIVASMPFLQELSNELIGEAAPLYRIRTPWATFVGFTPAVAGLEYVGVRLLGMVALKGLDKLDIGEIVPFAPGEADATPLDPGETLVALLRQEFHSEREVPLTGTRPDVDTTTERLVEPELVICLRLDAADEAEVLIGEWDPRSDDVRRPLRMAQGDFRRLFALNGIITADELLRKKENVRDLYNRLSDQSLEPAVSLEPYRANEFERFILGDVVEKL